MNAILANLLLANSLPVKKFLDTENYAENYKELAVSQVSMFCRSEANWQLVEPFSEIGIRCLYIALYSRFF